MASVKSVKAWKLLNSHISFSNRWLRLDIDQVRLPNGQIYDYTVMRREQHGAAIVVLNGQGQLLLEQEYRYPVDAVIWQLPGGLIDPGESALRAAKRELEEETGHVAKEWRLLGTIWDNPAFEDMEIHIFQATDIRFNGKTKPDQAEFIRCEWVDLVWVKEQIRAGTIKDRVLLAALGFLWAEQP